MKRIMFLVLSIAFMSAILVGCQSEGNTTVNTEKTSFKQRSLVTDTIKTDLKQRSIVADTYKTDIEQQPKVNETNTLDDEIAYISITNLNGNSDITFDDASSIDTLKSIIISAERVNGIVDMANPGFKMIVVYDNDNKQNFNLWIGKEGGKSALMNTADTHTIYTLSEAMTEKLLELIE
ncbi:hypothetical protein [Paenibacillus endoradicis]|uniref:hypothetical protein n=1 Tax=Paenibacillus endoradicis TaxID=2972487 RepID=UPI0021599D57|nr:hypothetical protein [Paenibacillus endoradicis]MCR8660584.1 hypothetical protein [Paenibacillus endoradicis]